MSNSTQSTKFDPLMPFLSLFAETLSLYQLCGACVASPRCQGIGPYYTTRTNHQLISEEHQKGL